MILLESLDTSLHGWVNTDHIVRVVYEGDDEKYIAIMTNGDRVPMDPQFVDSFTNELTLEDILLSIKKLLEKRM